MPEEAVGPAEACPSDIGPRANRTAPRVTLRGVFLASAVVLVVALCLNQIGHAEGQRQRPDPHDDKIPNKQ